jgi:hypothetical protein
VTRFLSGLPFVAVFALGCLFMVLGFWETLAIWTRRVPTISTMTASAWSGVALGWKVVILFAAGVVLGALLVHFTGWKPLPGTQV